MKIFLVGCGNLGKRYAEGLAKITNLEEFHCYDISNNAARETLDIFKDNRENSKLKLPVMALQDSINNILPKYDFCIVSSTAFKRAKLIKDLKDKSNIKNWIIEKVLEQSVHGISNIEKLNLNNAWVNTPRSSTKLWKDLKKLLERNNFTHSIINGSNINIGSNLIHFLDAYEFILNKKISSINIDKNLYSKNSKRKGFIELFGKISLIFANEFKLEINSKEGSITNCEIRFCSENNDLITIHNESSLLFNKTIIGNNYDEFRISEKIKDIIYNISQNNKCCLTELSKSIRQHKVFLSALENKKDLFLDQLKFDNKIPIT